MSDYSRLEILDGVELVNIPADRFKTNEIKISFCMPLECETASSNAIAISLLSNSSADYPNMTAINKKLAHLYGAELRSSVQKLGENQVLSLGISSLDDRFSLGGKISTESVELLLSLAFKPRFDENGDFYDEDIAREQRILVEKLESEENEKRTYALRRTEQIMFEGEPFATNRYGTVESARAVTSDDVKSSWNRMLSNAKIQLSVVGNIDENEIADKLAEAFVGVVRDYQEPASAVFKPSADDVKTVIERIDVKQGKLVLGFRVNMKPDDEKVIAMRSFCDTFSGGPYSKLFANVREKMSLCYYCSARYDRRKSCILIQCGCEEENMDKATAEILNQLDEIKNGNYLEELAASRVGLSDAINSVEDDSLVLLDWYAGQIGDGVIKSPAQSAKENDSVNPDDIKTCANLISLDTVYKLCSVKEGE